MTEISDQVVKVIKEAIMLEINGRSFFNHATEVTHNELGKKMFRKLAQDETEHLDSFGKLFKALTGGEEWRKLVDLDEVKGDSSLIDELNLRMKKGERASELEAISIGMELERKAVDFFEKSAREATDPKAKEILEKICEEEKFHYDLLQAQYDSVNNSGFWLDSAEFRMDGKF
ncbi:MAG: ferritin family protein [Candidatus Zixiibacteriota bacterium]